MIGNLTYPDESSYWAKLSYPRSNNVAVDKNKTHMTNFKCCFQLTCNSILLYEDTTFALSFIPIQLHILG